MKTCFITPKFTTPDKSVPFVEVTMVPTQAISNKIQTAKICEQNIQNKP
jgi:hypothetical protein